jgi:predicted amidohydrolase YtcJ
LFTQRPGHERDDFLGWTEDTTFGEGDDFFRLNGAGEMLVFSAADFEDFRQPRPDMPRSMEVELESVVRVLAERQWPWRLHATYDETISRALDVFEKVHRDIPISGLNWFFDHAETISDRSIERIAALGGGIAIQHRMAYQGEYFVQRYGAEAAERTPPICRILAAGVKTSAGTDATRVASYDPWVGLSWLVTGCTVGGLALYPRSNLLDRETALRMWTEYPTWFSNSEGRSGRIAVGQLADLAVLSADYFTVPDNEIRQIESVLTLVGGEPVFAADEFSELAPPPPPAMPDWSPVTVYGGYEKLSVPGMFGCMC